MHTHVASHVHTHDAFLIMYVFDPFFCSYLAEFEIEALSRKAFNQGDAPVFVFFMLFIACYFLQPQIIQITATVLISS